MVPCLETGLALVWNVRMTSEDPITLDQDPMQSWIRRCTLWRGGGGGCILWGGGGVMTILLLACMCILCISSTVAVQRPSATPGIIPKFFVQTESDGEFYQWV